MSYSPEQITERLSQLAEINDPIDPELYQKYDVKRGLRYGDGRGVLVGLTRIGDVVGYEMRGSEKTAVPGRLLYRGYNIEDIIKDTESSADFGYEQVAYLLLFGELPTADTLREFRAYLGSKRTLPEYFNEDMIMKAPSPDIMNKLARSVLASYSYDSNPEDVRVPNVLRQCIELIARFPVMVAYAFQTKRHYSDGKSLHVHIPDPELSTAENFLRLIRPNTKYTRAEAEILDLALVLHAEHGGGNNSTFSVHVVSSADTDTYSAIAAAVGSLKGRRHGGANLKIMEMMDEVKAHVRDWESEKEVGNYLRKILRKEAYDRTGLVYGMGHAVYTISDPRAILLRDKAQTLAAERGKLDEFNLYRLIEAIAPDIIRTENSTEKRICANVEFYSGFVYSLLSISRDLFTPIFAVSRIAGWSAHRIEEIVAGRRIYRPAFKNIGEERAYVPLSERG
jgi:citrate synthase